MIFSIQENGKNVVLKMGSREGDIKGGECEYPLLNGGRTDCKSHSTNQ